MTNLHKIKEQTNKLEIELRRLDESLLNETQRIEISKSELIKYIAADRYDDLKNYIYSVITRKPISTYISASELKPLPGEQSAEFSERQSAEFRKRYAAWDTSTNAKFPNFRRTYEELVQKADVTSSGWASWHISAGSGRYTGPNFKMYYTIGDDDFAAFTKSFTRLLEALKSATKTTEDNIKIKIPDKPMGLLNANDNIVIHFKNRDTKDAIDASVKQWATQNGVTLAQRTHTFGQDNGGQSYGYRLADVFVKYAKDFKTQGYTPEQIAQWIGQNFTKIISSVKI